MAPGLDPVAGKHGSTQCMVVRCGSALVTPPLQRATIDQPNAAPPLTVATVCSASWGRLTALALAAGPVTEGVPVAATDVMQAHAVSPADAQSE